VTVAGVVIDEVYAGMTIDAKPGPYVLAARWRTRAQACQLRHSRSDLRALLHDEAARQGHGPRALDVHTIVRGLTGFIHVYSELDKGTRFKIYLPADGSPVRSASQSQRPSPFREAAGELVLVVDDDANRPAR
jgi:two-component system cell cycle sensor histidine kinase/response regulator CckA